MTENAKGTEAANGEPSESMGGELMNGPANVSFRKVLGRIFGLLIVVAAAGAVLAVMREVQRNPRTDDAEVFANLIGIAPEVSGRIVVST